MWAGLVLPRRVTAVSSLRPPMIVPLYVTVPSSNQDTNHAGLGPTHVTLFSFDYLLKGPTSRYNHILSSWGLGGQHVNSAHNKPFFPGLTLS